MTEKHNLIDTNVIIHFPSVFQNLKNIHVHLKTVEELDRLKDNPNPDLAYRASKGAKLVKKNLQSITIEKDACGQKEVDDILLHCAKKKKMTLITNDLTLGLKCHFNKVSHEEYTNGDKTVYSGVKVVSAPNVTISSDLESFDFSFCENEYLVFKDTNKPIQHIDGSVDYESVAQFIRKGDKLIKVKDFTISNAFNKKIAPRNVEQKCLLNTLYDKSISIICVTGGFGTGY